MRYAIIIVLLLIGCDNPKPQPLIHISVQEWTEPPPIHLEIEGPLILEQLTAPGYGQSVHRDWKVNKIGISSEYIHLSRVGWDDTCSLTGKEILGNQYGYAIHWDKWDGVWAVKIDKDRITDNL